MILKIKKVPVLKSALFLLLSYSLYSCHLEPRQPEDKRERNFKYRQQVLNQEHNDDITADDEIQNPHEPPPPTEKETLFNEFIDPRFSQQTLKLSEEEAQQLRLLSFKTLLLKKFQQQLFPLSLKNLLLKNHLMTILPLKNRKVLLLFQKKSHKKTFLKLLPLKSMMRIQLINLKNPLKMLELLLKKKHHKKALLKFQHL